MVPSRSAQGFTLVELITVLILIGILAVAALPRMMDQNVFAARGFLDETMALLRFAQKAAIAERRDVCVTLAGNGVGLSIAGAAGVGAACNTALALPNPARGGNGLAASVANFRFRADGSTDQAADITVNVAGATNTITIDRQTGYVR